ncbi:MAG: hypothetical protein HFF73_04745 [Oscillospiraceae bacterium]|nr:hypothetical protein [Oscillospiraceae bacterium]
MEILLIMVTVMVGGIHAFNPSFSYKVEAALNELFPLKESIGKPTKLNLALIRLLGVLLLGLAVWMIDLFLISPV